MVVVASFFIGEGEDIGVYAGAKVGGLGVEFLFAEVVISHAG